MGADCPLCLSPVLPASGNKEKNGVFCVSSVFKKINFLFYIYIEKEGEKEKEIRRYANRIQSGAAGGGIFFPGLSACRADPSQLLDRVPDRRRACDIHRNCTEGYSGKR